MKPAKGHLQSHHVIVTNSKDVGRLFQKSSFGKTLLKNNLQLSLIESAFLIEDQKLNIYKHNEKISFDEIITIATDLDPFFEEKYLVFCDLRKRGLQVKLSTDSPFTFHYIKKDEQSKKTTFHQILAISERQIPSLFQLQDLVDHASESNNSLWLGLVDEEGDITYYALTNEQLKGENDHHKFEQVTGLLLSNRVAIFDKDISKKLHIDEFFGKSFGEGLQISLVEALYQQKQGALSCSLPDAPEPLSKKAFIDEISNNQHDIMLRYQVFSDLKKKGLIVKTGFKFGTHFRGYRKSPFHSHAEYLIHAIDESYQTQWSEISRAVRLAHAVNKTLIFGLVKKKNPPIYLSITRIRP